MVPKRALLSPVTTPPVGFQTRPPVLLQVFLHSGNLFSIPVCTEVVCLSFTFTPLCYKLTFLTWTFFDIQLMRSTPPPLCLSLAWKLSSVSVFLSSAHTLLWRQSSVCSGESSSFIQSFPHLCKLGGILCCRSAEHLMGRRRDKSCSTLGSFSRHISDVEVFLEKPNWYKAQIYTAVTLS